MDPIQAFYDTYNRGDLDAALALFTPDARLENRVLGQTYEGASAIRGFWDEFAEIVDGCTDTYEYPKPPWKARKEKYIEHVRQTDDMGVLRVSLADKLHNARAIHFDLLAIGDELWDRFRSGRDEVLWYYETLADEFERKDAGPMVKELRRTVANIRADSS